MARPKPDEPHHRYTFRLPVSLWLRFYERVRALGRTAHDQLLSLVKEWLETER